MPDIDQGEFMRLLLEAQTAFDELFADGLIPSRLKAARVEKLTESGYYAVRLFSPMGLTIKVFWLGGDSFESFKTAVREAVLRA
jgi:hypothetical protein